MDALYGVWLSPRATVRDVQAGGGGVPFVPLAGIYGAANNLNKVITRGVDPSQDLSAMAVLGLNLVFGFASGAVFLYGLSFPLSWVGRLLGGVATPRGVRTALALASVPFVPLLVVAVVLTLLGPSTLLVRSGGSPVSAVTGTIWESAVVLYFVLWGVLAIWLCVIGIVGLSEVHAFSIGRSMVSCLIVGAGLVALFMVGVAMVAMIIGGA